MSEHRLTSIALDSATLHAATAEIEHERRVAIFDLVEKNSFEPAGAAGGPYGLKLAMVDGRLAFDITGPEFHRVHGGPTDQKRPSEQGGGGADPASPSKPLPDAVPPLQGPHQAFDERSGGGQAVPPPSPQRGIYSTARTGA